MADSVFLTGIRAMYDARLYLESKIVREGVSVANWSKQLIGNRSGSYLVECEAEIDNQTITVKLSNWSPTRDLPGYNGEHVATPVSGSSDVWSQYRDKTLTAENAPREAIALVGYLFDQLLTGKILSSESAGKAYLLDKMLSILKPKRFEIKITPVANVPQMGWNLSQLKALVNVCKPRVETLVDLPAREVSRRARTKRKVVSL